MAMKKMVKKPAKKETGQDKLQRLSDTYQYANASKRSNSPSASTRSRTSGIAFMKQQNKMPNAQVYAVGMSKRDRMMDAAGIKTGVKFVSPDKPFDKNYTVTKKPMSGGRGGNPKTVTKSKGRNKY